MHVLELHGDIIVVVEVGVKRAAQIYGLLKIIEKMEKFYRLIQISEEFEFGGILTNKYEEIKVHFNLSIVRCD